MGYPIFPGRRWLAALVLASLPVLVHAQLDYTLSNNSATVTGYTGPAGPVAIPPTLGGDPVVSIAANAFQDSVAASVTMPNTVTNIGADAFTQSSLAGITLSTNLISIGAQAFYQCLLTNVTIPNSVTTIGTYAFYSCASLTNVIISTNLRVIGDSTFASCHLVNLVVPNSVTNLGNDAFYDCGEIVNMTLSTNLLSIGQETFEFCQGLTSVTIPASVTSIGSDAFASDSIGSVYFLGNAPSADTTVFQGDNVTVYYLPGTTGWGATFGGANTKEASTPAGDFLYTTNNNSITITGYNGPAPVIIPSTINGYAVTAIGTDAFAGYGVTSVSLPGSVTNIGEFAFDGCSSLGSISIPANVIGIGFGAFSDCASMTGISVAGGNPAYSSLNNVLFDKAQDTLIQYPTGSANGAYTVPGTVTNIAQDAFYNCRNLVSVTIPGSVASIGSAAFQDCTGLTSVTMSAGVGSLGSAAFSLCTSLTNLTLPATITSIGQYAFQNSTSLQSVYFLGNAPSVGGGLFQGDSATVYYLPGTSGWGASFGGAVAVEEPTPAAQFTCITNSTWIEVISYTGTNKAVLIPSTINGYPVDGLAGNAFSSATQVTSVAIPASISVIPGNPFAGCSSLTNISVDPANPAFSSTNGVLFDLAQDTLIAYPIGLTNRGYAVPGTVATIGPGAFAGCPYLVSVTIPGSVTSIGQTAFYECNGLVNVAIPDSVHSLGDDAFYYCAALSSVTIGSGVTSIGSSTFALCFNLGSVYFQGNAPSGNQAFYEDNRLTVYYFQGTTGWGATYEGVPAVEQTSPADFLYTNVDNSITITGYTGTNEDVLIPDNIGGYPVTSIGVSAFQFGSLVSVTMPNSITNIGGAAFYFCGSLTNVVMSTNITDIGVNAFGICYNLASLTIPASVTTIEDEAFQGCAFTSITIPAGVTNLGAIVFYTCNNLTNISVSAANPDYSDLNGVLFDKAKTTLLQYPLGAPDTAYAIPDTVTNIAMEAFLGCVNLTSVSIPDSVTTIGLEAFAYTSFASVTVPGSVTSLGGEVFAYCGNLTTAYFMGNAPPNDSSIFMGDTGTVYYRSGANGWGSTFGGLPAVSWAQPPMILGGGSGPAATANGFGFNIAWGAGLNTSIVIEACTNLSNPVWTPVATNFLVNGTNYFSDPNWNRHPRRFYRVSSQ